MIIVKKADPLSAESQLLIEKLSAELTAITGSNGKQSFDSDTVKNHRAVWALARSKCGEAVGCGAIRPLSETIAELKRMFSTGQVPGTGTALLHYLETAAKELGYHEIWLETRVVNQRAVAFYLGRGYRQIANYGPYTGREEAICFAKCLINSS